MAILEIIFVYSETRLKFDLEFETISTSIDRSNSSYDANTSLKIQQEFLSYFIPKNRIRVKRSVFSLELIEQIFEVKSFNNLHGTTLARIRYKISFWRKTSTRASISTP